MQEELGIMGVTKATRLNATETLRRLEVFYLSIISILVNSVSNSSS